jgi:hypothetical protein
MKTNPKATKTESIEKRERERDLNDGTGAEGESGVGEAIGENESVREIGVDSALKALEAHFFIHFWRRERESKIIQFPSIFD